MSAKAVAEAAAVAAARAAATATTSAAAAVVAAPQVAQSAAPPPLSLAPTAPAGGAVHVKTNEKEVLADAVRKSPNAAGAFWMTTPVGVDGLPSDEQKRANDRQKGFLRQTVFSSARAAVRGAGASLVFAASDASSAPARLPAYERLARFCDGIYGGDANHDAVDAFFREMCQADPLRHCLLSELPSKSDVVANGAAYRVAAHALAGLLALCDAGASPVMQVAKKAGSDPMSLLPPSGGGANVPTSLAAVLSAGLHYDADDADDPFGDDSADDDDNDGGDTEDETSTKSGTQPATKVGKAPKSSEYLNLRTIIVRSGRHGFNRNKVTFQYGAAERATILATHASDKPDDRCKPNLRLTFATLINLLARVLPDTAVSGPARYREQAAAKAQNERLCPIGLPDATAGAATASSAPSTVQFAKRPRTGSFASRSTSPSLPQVEPTLEAAINQLYEAISKAPSDSSRADFTSVISKFYNHCRTTPHGFALIAVQDVNKLTKTVTDATPATLGSVYVEASSALTRLMG